MKKCKKIIFPLILIIVIAFFIFLLGVAFGIGISGENNDFPNKSNYGTYVVKIKLINNWAKILNIYDYQ